MSGLAPGGYLRATRRQAADSFEERLLASSDRGYRLTTPTASWPSAASYRRSPPPNAMPFTAAQASLVTHHVGRPADVGA